MTEGKLISFDYVNYRGERARRRACIIGLRFGSSEYHPREQLLMQAIDLERNVIREFAVTDMSNIQLEAGK